MKFSVIIPAYNAARTIGATLDSVLAQTVVPGEILVFNDGSTDETAAILESYKPRVTVFHQTNQGPAGGRNFLCARARGDVLAFLDADDLWHPRYLEVQRKLIEAVPDAIACFTDHENIFGMEECHWGRDMDFSSVKSELIGPVDFIRQYDKTPLRFQMSCFCLRTSVLNQLGKEPFKVSGAEDTYLHNTLPLLGPVAHTGLRLVAYRINEASLSSNRLKVSLLVLDAFELLDAIYKSDANKLLYDTFKTVHVSRMRNCGKYLMGAGRTGEARRQFGRAFKNSTNLSSSLKSLLLLFSSRLPSALGPAWPQTLRESKTSVAR